MNDDCYARRITCHACGGKGYVTPWSRKTLPRTCELCDGSGRVPVLPLTKEPNDAAK